MATIRLKNFGPIRDTGDIHLTEVVLIIGRQSSGKSTFMKVLCYCRWLEKRIMTSSDNVISEYTHYKRFVKELKQFHHIDETYYSDDTEIFYDGDVVRISLAGQDRNAQISRKPDAWAERYNTKLAYIPAERNLVSAVRNINSVYKTADRDAIFNFIQEWNEAKSAYTASNTVPLSVCDDFRYYCNDGQDYIMLPSGKSVSSFFASSGVQSVAPVDVMSVNVMGLVGKTAKFSREDLMNRIIEMLDSDDASAVAPDTVSESKIATMRDKMRYQSAQLYIEEPEQNLYPDAQRLLVQNIVRRLKSALGNGSRKSMVMMTTHSPYVLSTLNALMADADAMERLPEDVRLKELVDEGTLLPLGAYSAFFINDEGAFVDIRDREIPMLSGIDLDSVSDWVDDHIAQINDILYP